MENDQKHRLILQEPYRVYLLEISELDSIRQSQNHVVYALHSSFLGAYNSDCKQVHTLDISTRMVVLGWAFEQVQHRL